MKIYINGQGHMAKMAAMAINSKTLQKTRRPMILKLGMNRVGVIKIVIVINCNLITFSKIIESNCNSAFTLITIIEM